MTDIIHQPHDKLFKQSMADIRVAREFFEAHLPKLMLEKIDQTTLKLEKHSFIDAAYKSTEADVVYSAKLKEGGTSYFYILCEQQSKVVEHMAFRLLVYKVRLMELHLKRNPKDPMPIVYQMVLYSGEEPWHLPRDVFSLFGEQAEYAKQLWCEPFQLIELNKIDDKELRRRLWSGLMEFTLKHRMINSFETYIDNLMAWLHAVEIEQGVDFVKIVLRYVLSGVSISDEKLFIRKSEEYFSPTMRGEAMTLAERFEEIGHEKGFIQGRAQGLEQGRATVRKELIKKMLEKHLPVQMIVDITGLSAEIIESIVQEKVVG